MDPELIDVAVQMGLPRPIARAFETPKELAEFVANQQAAPQLQTAAPLPPAEAQPVQLPDEVVQQLAEMESDGYSEVIIAAFRKTAEEAARNRQQIEQLQSFASSATETAQQDSFDKWIDGLGQPGAFGAGSIMKLDRNSPEVANRVAVYREFQKLRGNGLHEQAARTLALHTTVGCQPAKPAPRTVTKPADSDAAARARVNKFYADRGLLEGAIAGRDDDEI